MLIVTTVLAYLLGGVPFGYLFVRLTLGKDVRTMGSGNIGATNVHRSVGGKAGLIVLILDIGKGFLAVWLASFISHRNEVAIALAIAAVLLGHSYPLFLRFQGGKAVACFVGAFLFAAPLALVAVAVLFFLAVAFTRYISLGSIVGAIAFPSFLWLIYKPGPPLLGASVFAAVLIVFRHRANLQRIRTGTENVFSFKGGSGR